MISILFLTNFVVSTQWIDPTTSPYGVNQNQAFQAEIGKKYVRLPDRAKDKVSQDIWDLSKHSSSISIHFLSNSKKITIQYTRKNPVSFDSMNQLSTSGIDLYAYNKDGHPYICFGNYNFGNPTTHVFDGLSGSLFEYHLTLPGYDIIDNLQIGVEDNTQFRLLKSMNERPIAVYGGSIVQGMAPNRPAISWVNWLSREMSDLPVLNFGFKDNGLLEASVIDLMIENDAQAYILDCLEDLIKAAKSEEEIVSLTVAAYKQIRSKWERTPIVLVESVGFANGRFDEDHKKKVEKANNALKTARQKLIDEDKGAVELYYVSADDIAMNSDDLADLVHPTENGMRKQMKAVAKQLKIALYMSEDNKNIFNTNRKANIKSNIDDSNIDINNAATVSPMKPIPQSRNEDFKFRHYNIVDLLHKENPKKVIIGDSITNYWGGRPVDSIARGPKSWADYMEKEGFINLGIGWDRIENALWRTYHDNFYNVTPEKIFSTIGTNNLDVNTDEEIVEGIRHLFSVIHKKVPTAKIYICGIFPRRNYEERITKLNVMLEKMANEESYQFINPGLKLLLDSGKVDESNFSDGLHPNEKGYYLLAPIFATA